MVEKSKQTYSESIVAKQTARNRDLELMLGAIRGNMSELGATSILVGGIHYETSQSSSGFKNYEISAPFYLIKFTETDTSLGGPKFRWRKQPLSDRLVLDAIKQLDPSAMVVEASDHPDLKWLYGLVVLTKDEQGFKRLIDSLDKIIPERYRSSLDASITSAPVTANFMDKWRQLQSDFKKTEAEMDALTPIVESLRYLKEAGRNLVLAETAGGAADYLDIKDVAQKADAWEAAHASAKRRVVSLRKRHSTLRSKEFPLRTMGDNFLEPHIF